MSTTRTSIALETLTDAGLFERLATAVLRYSDPLYERLVHTGVNASGRTIKSPLDGICYELGANPPHMVAVHHTTIARQDLDTKWLSTSPPGDVATASDFAKKQRKEQPQLRATLVLTTNREPSVDLVAGVHESAIASGFELDLWPRSRFVHFLDNTPSGQWLRQEYLRIDQELLSSELLHELSHESLQVNSPPSDERTWIPRSLDTDLSDRQFRDVTFVVAGSGTGKSISCYRRLLAHVRGGGFGLVLNPEVIMHAATLDGAIQATLQQLHPNLAPMGTTPLSLCSPDRRLLLVVDDGHRSTRNPSLVEKVARWSHAWNEVENPDAQPPIWQLLFPIWPEVLASLSDAVRQKLAPMTLITGRFSAIEAREAVFARARLNNLTISESDAEAISERLGRDPLLISLHDLTQPPDPNFTIGRFVDEVLRRVSADRGDFPDSEYRDALLALASAMLTARNLQPTWRTVKSWPTVDWETRSLIGTLLADGALMTLTGPSEYRQFLFRHDRVRDWLLTDAMGDLVSNDSLDSTTADDPYYADILGSVLVRKPLNRTLLARVSSSNPLAIFRALQLLGRTPTECRTFIRCAIDRWLAGPAIRDRTRHHLRHAALRILSETDSPDVPEIVHRFPERSIIGQVARLRNGDFVAGIELCCTLHPGTTAPWRDFQIDHAKTHHESSIVHGLSRLFTECILSSDVRIGALRLAGHLANPDLREAINTSWKVDDERLAHIGDYLWAFSRCCGDEPGRYLSPVCEAWATLSDRPTSEGETAARPAVSLHSLQWAFGRYPPMKAVAYLIRRGSHEDLRWPIMLLLQEIDDPEVLVFIVQELASRSRRYKDAESLPPYVDHVRDHWRRQQADSGRGMSIESRQRLLSIWRNQTEDVHMRRPAFALWEATRLPADVAVLREVTPADELSDSVLRARLARQDHAAVRDVIERQDADTHGWWLWNARHVWSPQLTDALDHLLARRGSIAVRSWGESVESDGFSCELLIRLPEAQAERLIMKHWAHLRFGPRFVQAAIYVSTPRLLEEVRSAIEECSSDLRINLLDSLGNTWGLQLFDHPGLVREKQLAALRPYLGLFSEADIVALWHACNEREWFDTRRELVDGHLKRPYPVGKWDRRQTMLYLDKIIDSWNPLFLDGWVVDLLRSGVLWRDILEVMIGWLRCKGSLRALECVAAAVSAFGLRSDLVAIESFKNMAPPQSHEIVEDTKFAVRRRSIE